MASVSNISTIQIGMSTTTPVLSARCLQVFQMWSQTKGKRKSKLPLSINMFPLPIPTPKIFPNDKLKLMKTSKN